MKMIKRIAVMLLALLLAFSACGCLHEKGEIAVTVGDTDFTSAYYMCEQPSDVCVFPTRIRC